MLPSVKVAVFLLPICVWIQAACAMDYNELVNLNISCYPRDSCHGSYSKPDPIDVTKTCECDPTCFNRGTCCIDSPYVDPHLSARNEVCSGETIIGVGRHYYFNHTITHSFFQVKQCHRRWNGPLQVKQLCEIERPVEGTDLMVAIPVTNTYSGISYKNYFCALCNNDIDGSVLWDFSIHKRGYESVLSERFKVEAPETPRDDSDYPLDGSEEASACSGSGTLPLVYNEEEAYYGYWDTCSSATRSFVWVTVTLSIPEQIQHLVKGCDSNLISTCAPGWTDARVKLKCGAYLGIIKAPRMGTESGGFTRSHFRNVHCAQCNNITNFEGYSCEPFFPGALINNPTYPMSLKILFGRLLSDIGCLGDNGRFGEGLGCRAVICANPLHKVINGKCSPA